MSSSDRKQVMGRLPEAEFLGRQREIDQLCLLAEEADGRSSNVLVMGGPRVGKTELLRQTFDRLFNQGGHCLPVYYGFSPVRLRAADFAGDFLSRFLSQFIAFQRADRQLLRSASN
jgi:hypothetical protein